MATSSVLVMELYVLTLCFALLGGCLAARVRPGLHLTPYISRGDIRQARELSLVTGLTPNVTSYSGFLTVDKECGSNMFFWFFPSQNDWLSDPVSVWLSGGPGTSSAFGLLTVCGPYELSLDGELRLREYSWNKNSSVIYIDNPVGTGYSYTSSLDCYASDEVQVGQNLLTALMQFYAMFPELVEKPLFLTGESYAGKYIPALGYAIHTSPERLNLQGLMIGNGFIDPVNQIKVADLLYQLGLADEPLVAELKAQRLAIVALIEEKKFEAANDATNYLLEMIAKRAGVLSPYNLLYVNGEPEPDYESFMNSGKVRRALHVEWAEWHDSITVADALRADMMQSVRPWLEVLLQHYRVLLFTGQLDIVCAYAPSLEIIKKLNWPGAAEFHSAPRKLWHVQGDLAGFVKSAANLTHTLVRNAGHMAARNQPQWTFELYNSFIFKRDW